MSLLIIDGSWLTCAMWWSKPAETPERFAATVARVAEAVGATGTPCVAWDAPGGSWRSELLPSYKAHRKPKPEALQLDLLRCRKLPGMEHLEVPGYEADDIIATLALAEVRKLGGPTYILTVDKDLAQLVSAGSNGVRLVNAAGEVTGPDEVETRWGVPPSHMRHLLSWCGDASDGLPGVRGIGPKKAIAPALLGQVGDSLTFDLVELATVPGLEGGAYR